MGENKRTTNNTGHFKLRNGFFDSNEFYEFMSKRIEEALLNSKEYVELQSTYREIHEANDTASYDEIESDIEVKSQELCYLQGWKDAVKMMAGCLN